VGFTAKPVGFAPGPPKPKSGLLVDINPVAPSKRVLETAAADDGPMIDPDEITDWASPEDEALAAHGKVLREQMMAAFQATGVQTPVPAGAAQSSVAGGTPNVTNEAIQHSSVVEEFIQMNGIAFQVANTLRQSHWAVQNDVIRRGFRRDTMNPSGVLLTRIHSANEHFTLLNHYIISSGIESDTVQVLMESSVGIQKGIIRLQYTNTSQISDYVQQCKALAVSVEAWITDQGIDEDAADTFRDCDPSVQRDIICNNSRLKYSNNPSGALVGRIKKVEEYVKGGVIK
jgi:hypothetical protein